jgi:hypothetical protein
VLAAPFADAHLRIVLALFDLTYGSRRRSVHTTATKLAIRAGRRPCANAKRVGGSFRGALKVLIDEGVIVRADGAGRRSPRTVAVQTDYRRWGRFAVANDQQHHAGKE